MALIIYSNGIVEELVSIGDTFSHRELVDSFTEYTSLETFRLPDVPNTWCLWGEMNNPPENEFNKIGSEIVVTEIFSHLIFIHDSELNRDWNMTDEILQKSYKEWMDDLAKYTNHLIENISKARQATISEKDRMNMIFLTTLGHTPDKRVLFKFNPNEQADNFYEVGFSSFAHNIFKYLEENFYKEPVEESKPFVVYADTKTIVIVDNEDVDQFFKHMLDVFEKNEAYETCSKITDIKNAWDQYIKIPGDINTAILDPSTGPPKKKRGRPPKNKAD